MKSQKNKVLVVLPARMGAMRLPGKPLADIHGRPMIWRSWNNVSSLGMYPTYVACDGQEIADLFPEGAAVITGDHATGTDRMKEAADIIDPDKNFDIVINVQGDTPVLDASVLEGLVAAFDCPDVSVATLVGDFKSPEHRATTASVKAFCRPHETHPGLFRCDDFDRSDENAPPFGEPCHVYYHWGVYAYRRRALEEFVTWSQTQREKERSLEQLRALDNGLPLFAVHVGNKAYMCVDTPEDLVKVRTYMAQSGGFGAEADRVV